MFMNANLFLGSVVVWHPREDDSYRVDMPVLTPIERVNVNHNFDCVDVSIPLYVPDLFDLEDTIFFVLYYYYFLFVVL